MKFILSLPAYPTCIQEETLAQVSNYLSIQGPASLCLVPLYTASNIHITFNQLCCQRRQALIGQLDNQPKPGLNHSRLRVVYLA